MNRCSILCVIKEMQIKTIKRYHYTPISMAKTWNIDNTKYWRGYRATGLLVHCSAASYESKQTLTMWSSNHSSWCLPKGDENSTQKPAHGLFKIYFIDYAITVVPFSPLYSPPPCTSPCTSIPTPLVHVRGSYI